MAKAKKCRRCGGNRRPRDGGCNICDLLGQGKVPGGSSPGAWPKTSLAFSCTPRQVEAMNARNRERGVGAHYEPDGTCVVSSAREFVRLKRLEGQILGPDFCDE